MRVVLVWQADPAAAYAWVPPSGPGDAVVSFDALAAQELDECGARNFDDLIGWEQRSAAQHHVARLVACLRDDEALATRGFDGHALGPFVEFRARAEFAHVLRGFSAGLALGGAARSLVEDPALPAAVGLGARAALGLDVEHARYLPDVPAVKPEPLKRLGANAAMRTLAAATPVRNVRVAAVLNARVAPAITALPRAQLRAAGLGAMPFPGLDYGNSARLAARLRIPFLATLDPVRTRRATCPELGAGPAFPGEDPRLATALRRVTRGLVEVSWPRLVEAAYAVRGLRRARDLRALVLPTTAVGASRLLMDWAHRRGIAVASVQHGVYGFREHDGGDSRADVLFAWSERVGEQALAWPQPRPRIVAVGVPGMACPPARPPAHGPPRRVLVATTGRPIESALGTTSFHEQFIAVIAPGLRTLMHAGVRVELRLHPLEDRLVYRRILAGLSLDVPFAAAEPLPDAIRRAELLVAAPSSVAFEAGVLGAPVLVWTGGTPLAIRQEHLLAPLSLDLPGMFGDAAQFQTLTRGLVAEGAPTLAMGRALAAQLGSYARPFDAGRFGQGLVELAG